jgi:hypothetical protein
MDDHLREYMSSRGTGPDRRIFPISCIAGRRFINKAGRVDGTHLRALKGVNILPKLTPINYVNGLQIEKHIEA